MGPLNINDQTGQALVRIEKISQPVSVDDKQLLGLITRR
jgi:hypothetical protein